jgi:hypothetical protein
LGGVPDLVLTGTEKLAKEYDVKEDDPAEGENHQANGELFSPGLTNIGALHSPNPSIQEQGPHWHLLAYHRKVVELTLNRNLECTTSTT